MDERPTHLDLFSGVGGFVLAARWAGFRTIGFCEIDEWCRKVLAKNFGAVPVVDDIHELICALRNNKRLRSGILKSLIGANSKSGFHESANSADQYGHIPEVSQSEIEADGSVRGNVAQLQCEDQVELIQAVGNGCGETETQIGSMVMDLRESQCATSRSKRNGGGESLPETNTPAANVVTNRKRKVNSTRTTSSDGAISLNSDLKSLMDELYANLVTRGFTTDLLTAGFPCQPYSVAGQRRGASDDRALWPRLFEVIEILRPAFCLLENVAGIIGMELDAVLSDLEGIGYATRTFAVPACAVDAPHRRNRTWIVAHSGSIGNNGRSCERGRSQSPGSRDQLVRSGEYAHDVGHAGCRWPDEGEWFAQSGMGRVAHGIPRRVDRLKGLGNAIVPQVAYQILKPIYALIMGTLL